MARLALSRNPSLSERIFEREARARAADAGTMTVSGTVNKAILLTGLVAMAAIWVWFRVAGHLDRSNPNSIATTVHAARSFLALGAIGGLVVCLVTCFKPSISRFSAVPYAVLEGLFIGGLAAMLEPYYPFIAIQAAALTFGVLLAMLVVYKTGLVEVTDRFRRGVFMAIGAVFLIYIVSFLMSLFPSAGRLPYIHESGILGIGFSLVVIGIASAALLVDFDMIERGERGGAPGHMEWYGAFGLLVTLVWLYVEILHLLMKLRNR